MALTNLTSAEQEVVLRVVKLILEEERLIEDWEFRTRMGVTRDEVRRAIARWPLLEGEEDELSDGNMAIHNSLNEALNGLRVPEAMWAKWIGVPREEVRRIWRAWRALTNAKARG